LKAHAKDLNHLDAVSDHRYLTALSSPRTAAFGPATVRGSIIRLESLRRN
jgi:hypothetical protein